MSKKNNKKTQNLKKPKQYSFNITEEIYMEMQRRSDKFGVKKTYIINEALTLYLEATKDNFVEKKRVKKLKNISDNNEI